MPIPAFVPAKMQIGKIAGVLRQGHGRLPPVEISRRRDA
jgi:hypothetical protein